MKIRRVLGAVGMLRVWLLTRGVKASFVVSEGFSGIWAEWRGPPCVYIECLPCPNQMGLGPCREPVGGELEVFILSSNPGPCGV